MYILNNLLFKRFVQVKNTIYIFIFKVKNEIYICILNKYEIYIYIVKKI